MLRALVKKELLHHLASYRYLVSSMLLVALAGLATLAGAADYDQRRDTYETELAKNELELRQARVYSYLQPMALRPPEPLAVFERGFEGRFGTEVRIHVYSIPTLTGTARRNPFMDSFRSLDLVTVIEVILGLQALLLTFDAVVGEREQKNLQLVLAQGVCRATVLAGKLCGAFLALLGPLVFSFALALAIVLGRGGVEIGRGEGLRLAGVAAACAAYLGVMLLLGLFISLKSTSAPRALAFAVLTWLVLVFLLPQTASAVLDEATRGSGALEKAVTELEEERDLLAARTRASDPLRFGRSGHHAPVLWEAAHGAVLRRSGSAKLYDSLARYYREETALGMEYAERVFELRQERVREARKAELVATIVTSLSPAFLLERIANSFVNTSIEETEAFFATCRAYRRELIEFLRRKEAFSSWRWFTDDDEPRPWTRLLGLEPEEVDESNFNEFFNRFVDPDFQHLRTDLSERGQAPDLDLSGLPRFAFEGTAPLDTGRRASREALLLAGLGGLLAGASLRTFGRYGAG